MFDDDCPQTTYSGPAGGPIRHSVNWAFPSFSCQPKPTGLQSCPGHPSKLWLSVGGQVGTVILRKTPLKSATISVDVATYSSRTFFSDITSGCFATFSVVCDILL